MLMCEWKGCAVRGQHGSECVDPDCRGCRPRTVDTGRLCAVHVSWLNRDLADAAEIAVQVRESIIRGKSGDEQVVRSARLEPPAPLVASAVDAADELIAQLVSVAERLAPDFGVSPPSCRVWRSGHRVQGFPAGTSPHRVGAEVRKVVEWFRLHRLDLMYMPDVLDFGEELHDRLGKMRARWPVAERARHLPGTVCDQCGLMDVWWTPPNGVGWPSTIECGSCDFVAPESDLIEWVHAIELAGGAEPKKKWVTYSEAAVITRRKPRTIRRWVKEHHLTPWRGLINRNQLLIVVKRMQQAQRTHLAASL